MGTARRLFSHSNLLLPFFGALGIVLCHHLTQPAAGLASPNHCTGNMFFCGNAAGTAVEGGFN